MIDAKAPEPYVARLRTAPLILLVVVCGLFFAGFAGMAIAAAQDPSFDIVAVLSLLVVVGGLGLSATLALSGLKSFRDGGVVLRVDQRGVVLGRMPAHLRVPHEVVVPWADIDAVVLFAVNVPRSEAGRGGAMRCIGLRLKPGVVPPRGEPRRESIWHPMSRFKGPVPVDLGRPITKLWQFDRHQLVAAVKAHAPRVKLIELDT